MRRVQKCILFMDIVGSSKLWKKHSETMTISLDKFMKRITNLVEYYEGMIVKMMGDAFMIVFNDVTQAYSMSFKLQSMSPIMVESDTIKLRIGMCFDDMNEKKYKLQNCELIDYFGNAVNTASRMESKVSKVGGFAVGMSHINNDDINILESLMPINFSYKISHYKSDCKLLLRRSGRLLNNHHIYCKDIKKLHGIDKLYVISVFPK